MSTAPVVSILGTITEDKVIGRSGHGEKVKWLMWKDGWLPSSSSGVMMLELC